MRRGRWRGRERGRGRGSWEGAGGRVSGREKNAERRREGQREGRKKGGRERGRGENGDCIWVLVQINKRAFEYFECLTRTQARTHARALARTRTRTRTHTTAQLMCERSYECLIVVTSLEATCGNLYERESFFCLFFSALTSSSPPASCPPRNDPTCRVHTRRQTLVRDGFRSSYSSPGVAGAHIDRQTHGIQYIDETERRPLR